MKKQDYQKPRNIRVWTGTLKHLKIRAAKESKTLVQLLDDICDYPDPQEALEELE